MKTVRGIANFANMLEECMDNSGTLFVNEGVNVEKLAGDHIGFLRSSKMSVPILIHGISGISWGIIGSAGYWLRSSN